jgi:hypothetical protein
MVVASIKTKAGIIKLFIIKKDKNKIPTLADTCGSGLLLS